MSLPRWKYGVAVAAVAVTFGGMAVAGALPGLSYASGPTVKFVTAAAEETTTTSTTSTTTTTTKVDASTTTTTQEESTTTTAAPVVGGVTVTCVDDDHAKAKHESDDHESNDRDSDDPVSTSTSTTSTSSTTTAVNPTVPRGHDCDDQNEHEVDHEDAKDTRPVVSGNAIGGNSGQHRCYNHLWCCQPAYRR